MQQLRTFRANENSLEGLLLNGNVKPLSYVSLPQLVQVDRNKRARLR
jgi:hypothetical protein